MNVVFIFLFFFKLKVIFIIIFNNFIPFFFVLYMTELE